MTPQDLRRCLAEELGRPTASLGGDWPEHPDDLHPVIPAPVHRTARGTAYLRDAGVALLARPQVDLRAAQPFLDDLEPGSDYLRDRPLAQAPSLVKFAGQLCYLSVGRDRTRNVDAGDYLRRIKESGHGSVLEHACYTVLLWGVSRALTHELVRHRAGTAYSQVSQRYVPPRRLRFVEAYEYRDDPEARAAFEAWIDGSAAEYLRREQRALRREHPHDFDAEDRCRRCGAAAMQVVEACDRCGATDAVGATVPESCPVGDGCHRLSVRVAAESPCGEAARSTEARKRVRQAARRCLPNEAEAPIVMTGNLRAWRHCVEMRCSRHADVEIRRAFWRVFLVLAAADPLLWEDYEVEALPDGTRAVATPYRKV